MPSTAQARVDPERLAALRMTPEHFKLHGIARPLVAVWSEVERGDT